MSCRYLLSIFFFLLIQLCCRAQIKLEHSFPEQDAITISFVTQKGIQYHSLYKDRNEVVLYNPDFSEYKKIKVPVNSGEFTGVLYISDELFNLDSDIEFFVVTVNDGVAHYDLVNENGEVIFDFGKGTPYLISDGDKKTKLLMSKMTIDHSVSPPKLSFTNDVYSLPGKIKHNF